MDLGSGMMGYQSGAEGLLGSLLYDSAVAFSQQSVFTAPLISNSDAVEPTLPSTARTSFADAITTGSLVPFFPADATATPLPPVSSFSGAAESSCLTNTAQSTVPEAAALTKNKKKNAAKSTPLKPPKKYRVAGDDCDIQRCKRSLNFVGGDRGSEEKLGRPRASVERRNKRERLRVKQINNTFVTLRNQLPSNCHSPKRSAKKFSKVDTLRMAIEYIRGLQQLIHDHDAMYMSAECLARLSSPALPTPHGGAADVEHAASYHIPLAFDSASDRSGAESVGSSAPDHHHITPHSLTDFYSVLERTQTEELLDAFFLDNCNFQIA